MLNLGLIQFMYIFQSNHICKRIRDFIFSSSFELDIDDKKNQKSRRPNNSQNDFPIS